MRRSKWHYLKATACLLVCTSLLHLAVGVIRAWLSEWETEIELRAVNVLVSTATGVFLLYCHDSGHLHRVGAWVRAMSLKQLLRACVGLVAAHPMLLFSLLLTLALGMSAPPVETLAAGASAMYNAASTFGTICVVIWMMSRFVFDAVRLGAAGIGRLIVRVSERVVLLWLALVAIRRFSPELSDLLDAIRANPDASVASILGAAFVWLALSLATRSPLTSPRDAYPPGAAVMGRRATRVPRLQRDIRRTAVHEAGHILLFAALPAVPERLSVEVMSALSPFDHYRGQVVSSDDLIPTHCTESHLRWSMLLHLAGSRAELFEFSDRADGSCEDNQHWASYATHYLGAGFGEVFYPVPTDQAMHEHNRLVLNDLRRQQEVALDEFFTLNAEVLKDLAELLEQRLRLGRDDLLPILSGVRFTSRVPHLPS